MLYFVSLRVHKSELSTSRIRAKMLVAGELQGPLAEIISVKIVLKHPIAIVLYFSHWCYRSCWLVYALAGQTCW